MFVIIALYVLVFFTLCSRLLYVLVFMTLLHRENKNDEKISNSCYLFRLILFISEVLRKETFLDTLEKLPIRAHNETTNAE